MIKLKSLFRRGGQGPSGSSKQSTNSTNQLRGAASTSSLNSIGLSTTSSSTTATTKSTKSTLKKGGHTGSNDHFESATFLHESHESLDIKNASKLYAQSSGSGNIGSSSSISAGINLSYSGGGGGNGTNNNSGGSTGTKYTTHSPESAASISASSNKQYGFGVGSRTHDELRADQLHYIQTSMLMPAEQQLSSKSASTSGCVNKFSSEYNRDSDNETGVDDGGTSCFSGSMRDLLSTENLTENCTFNGTDESQRNQFIHELQQNLEQITREKMNLETEIMKMSSYKSEVMILQSEIMKLQNNYDKALKESQQLIEENESLRNRLRDVVNSPLSDAEKQQIIDDSQRLHSSAPASIAIPNNDGEGSSCLIASDWDKHSSSSEVSVACLQDKIIQMEETHYSTNEELQATLHELADLQSQLTELQSDNDRLAEEKDVLFQSLCRQTEKLEDSRNKISKLQDLLLMRESNQEDAAATSEREQKLLDLLKSAEDERERMFVKHEELQSDLKETQSDLDKISSDKLRLLDRINLLDSTIDTGVAERKKMEADLMQLREEKNGLQIEINRLTAVLENARSKIDEFEQERVLGDNKSDLRDLLDTTRQEKDILESNMSSLQESLSKSRCEVHKLKDQIATLTEECKVMRHNAKCALSNLEFKFEQLTEEKIKLSLDLQHAQENIAELQTQNSRQQEDKAKMETRLAETQRFLTERENLLAEKEDALNNERKLRKFENEEWKQFQSDLLMTVRVANDFKTEAQMAHEQLVIDNKTQRDRIRALEQENLKLTKAMASQDTQNSLLNSVVQQEIAQRRQRVGIARQDTRLSVKSLIESIEKSSHVKGSSQDGISGSHCSSSSSINSMMSDVPMLQSTRHPIGEWSESSDQSSQMHTSFASKSPLLEKPAPNFNCDNNHNKTTNNSMVKINSNKSADVTGLQSQSNSNTTMDLNQKYGFIIGERKDPLSALVKNGGSKRNALLKWCQNKTVGYRNIDITNFSSSWNDGLAFCAIMHSYLKDQIPYDSLGPHDKRRNFTIAFSAAESVGIHTTLNINNMCQQERPDWQQILAYVTAIYKHFET